MKMVSSNLTRVGGVLLLGAFALTVYIGFDDSNLRNYQPLHWEINWVFAAANVIAAVLLLGLPRKIPAVVLGGIVWPILYGISLVVDVETRLCIGGNQANCWPSKTAAYQYLILGDPNVPNGYGWHLWQGTVPTILALMFVAFVISIITVYSLRAGSVAGSRQPSVPSTGPSTGLSAGNS
jgi:MFS superfamily sulfate permease-like transporter